MNNNSEKILEAIVSKSCHTLTCSDNWEIERKKLVSKSDICLDTSGNNIIFNYEYKGKYYTGCSKGILINSTDIQSCECDTQKCLSCPKEALSENLCLTCNNSNGYYEIENDNYFHIDGYVKCHKDPSGYYLDKNESIYKKCYYTCKECGTSGNNITHNCLICDENYPYQVNISNYSNCYINSSYYHIFDEENSIISSYIYNNYSYILNSTYSEKLTELTTETIKFIEYNEIENLTGNVIESEQNEA